MIGSIGFLTGIYLCWPGITKPNGWGCAKDIVIDSIKGKKNLRTALAIPPKYFLSRGSYDGPLGKLRIVGDTCFR